MCVVSLTLTTADGITKTANYEVEALPVIGDTLFIKKVEYEGMLFGVVKSDTQSERAAMLIIAKPSSAAPGCSVEAVPGNPWIASPHMKALVEYGGWQAEDFAVPCPWPMDHGPLAISHSTFRFYCSLATDGRAWRARCQLLALLFLVGDAKATVSEPPRDWSRLQAIEDFCSAFAKDEIETPSPDCLKAQDKLMSRFRPRGETKNQSLSFNQLNTLVYALGLEYITESQFHRIINLHENEPIPPQEAEQLLHQIYGPTTEQDSLPVTTCEAFFETMLSTYASRLRQASTVHPIAYMLELMTLQAQLHGTLEHLKTQLLSSHGLSKKKQRPFLAENDLLRMRLLYLSMRYGLQPVEVRERIGLPETINDVDGYVGKRKTEAYRSTLDAHHAIGIPTVLHRDSEYVEIIVRVLRGEQPNNAAVETVR